MYDGIVAARVSGSVQSLRRTSMMERVGVYRYRTMKERVGYVHVQDQHDGEGGVYRSAPA
jgi:hypothetical protein